jgi:hypothetical protein
MLLSCGSHCFGKSLVSKSSRFVEFNKKEMNLVQIGGRPQSRHGKVWPTNAFDEWRRCHKLSTEESIGGLYEKEDICDFVNMLLKFVL